jgi:class 3 adenylate cyclase
MLEVPWPDLGKALVTGLLAGGASIAVQCLVPFTVRALARLRKRGVGDGAMRVERRLAAILAADVVGYSRQMVADEEGTHTRLLSYRREVIEPKIREHRGRMVKNTGDGALVEFGSIVDAVRCALEMQRGIIARNAGVLPTRRIELRIGVNLGDVIVAADDIYGHGVNLAVRLEGLAPPGGICISAEAWRHARGTIAAEVIDLGEQQLKNIADPAHVYRARGLNSATAGPGRVPGPASRPRRDRHPRPIHILGAGSSVGRSVNLRRRSTASETKDGPARARCADAMPSTPSPRDRSAAG